VAEKGVDAYMDTGIEAGDCRSGTVVQVRR